MHLLISNHIHNRWYAYIWILFISIFWQLKLGGLLSIWASQCHPGPYVSSVACILYTALDQVWQHHVEKEQVCLLYNKHRENTAIKCSRWLAALAFLPNIRQDFCPYLAVSLNRFSRESSGECSFCRPSTKFDRLEVLVWQEDVNDR